MAIGSVGLRVVIFFDRGSRLAATSRYGNYLGAFNRPSTVAGNSFSGVRVSGPAITVTAPRDVRVLRLRMSDAFYEEPFRANNMHVKRSSQALSGIWLAKHREFVLHQ